MSFSCLPMYVCMYVHTVASASGMRYISSMLYIGVKVNQMLLISCFGSFCDTVSSVI